MADSSPDGLTREPQNHSGLRWTDPPDALYVAWLDLGADVLRFGGNESPYPPPQELMDAIAGAASRMNRYPFGMESSLAEALSARLECSPEQVMIAPGTSALLEAVIKGLGGPDHEIVCPDSSYPAYRGAASAVRARTWLVPLRPDGTCDIDGIANA